MMLASSQPDGYYLSHGQMAIRRRGIHMKKSVTCKRCGRNDLQWWQSKAGKWYLTYDEGVSIYGDGGRAIKTLHPAHECLVRDGELTEQRASLILRGRITTTAAEQAEAQAIDDADNAAFEARYGRKPYGVK